MSWIASPGDVAAERAVVREVVSEWNSTSGSHRNTMLLAIGWETDAAPEEHLKAGKPAMLYFSSAPAALDSVDQAQYNALKAFRDSCTTRGLYETYGDVDDFRRRFSRDLQTVMNSDGFASAPDTKPGVAAPAAPAISPDAVALLSAAAADGSGVILFQRFGGGSEITANDKQFNDDSTPRTIARWEAAIEDLEKRGFVKAANEAREVFEVTQRGYTAADSFKGAGSIGHVSPGTAAPTNH